MAQKLLDVKTGVTAAGQVSPATLTKWPEGGATAQVQLSAGTAVVRLRGSVITNQYEDIATFTLPVPVGEENEGALTDWELIPATFDKFVWNVDSISGGGSLTLAVVGVGV